MFMMCTLIPQTDALSLWSLWVFLAQSQTTQFLFSAQTETVFSVCSVAVRMKVTVYSCWFFLVLGSNAAAEIIHEVFVEKEQGVLRCPHPAGGKVTWSRKTNGSKVDLITIDGDKDIRYNDPHKQYSSLADMSLQITRAAVSDSGSYFCNNEGAVDLTVIPSGTNRISVTERTHVTLNCPPDVGGSEVPTWSRETAGKQQQIRHVSADHKTLTLTDVKLGDSGLYYCDGKPAAYLKVTKETTTTSTTTTTTSTTTTATTTSTTIATATRTSTPSQPNPAALMVGVTVPFTVLIIIIIVYFTLRRRSKRQGNEEIYHVYDAIQDGPPNGVGPATFSMTPFSGASDPTEPTYSTICEYPPTGTKMATESPYSLISDTVADGNNEVQTKLNHNTYFLLDKP